VSPNLEASEKRRTETGECCGDDGAELSPEQALGQALWRRGSQRAEARKRGRESNRRKPKKFRGLVLRLVGKKYSGEEGERFGPTLAAEHLAGDYDVEVNAQTLRRWVLLEGPWSRARKHRERRERKEHLGELVQMDGRFHNWLEERGPRGCLMNVVDDASGDTLARMGSEETIWATAPRLREMNKKRTFHLLRKKGSLLGRLAGSHQIPQRLVFLIRHPDRSQIPCAIAACQFSGVPSIRLHSVSRFDRYQGRRHHLTLHPKRRRLQINNISRRTCLVAGLQLLRRP
jgi:hypothetical protein